MEGEVSKDTDKPDLQVEVVLDASKLFLLAELVVLYSGLAEADRACASGVRLTSIIAKFELNLN